MSNCLIRGWLGSSSVTHTNTQRHLHLLNTWVDDGWCMSLSSSHHLSPCSTICHSSVAEFTGRAVRFNEASARRRERKKKKNNWERDLKVFIINLAEMRCGKMWTYWMHLTRAFLMSVKRQNTGLNYTDICSRGNGVRVYGCRWIKFYFGLLQVSSDLRPTHFHVL